MISPTLNQHLLNKIFYDNFDKEKYNLEDLYCSDNPIDLRLLKRLNPKMNLMLNNLG